MTYRVFDYLISKFLFIRHKKDRLLQPYLSYIPRWLKPNFLTAMRALVIIFLFLICADASSFTNSSNFELKFIIVVALYTIGFISDLMDGALARVSKSESVIGGYFDSIIDKIFILPFTLLLYQLFPYLYQSLLFFFIFKVFLIGLLLYLLYHHGDHIRLIKLRNYYVRIYTAGYCFFLILFVRDLS